MEIYWHTKKEHIEHLLGEVVFDIDNDYLHPGETCTLIFRSADDCVKAIQFLYPNATFNLSFNMAYYCGQVCDFDDHLWELKGYDIDAIRNSLLKAITTSEIKKGGSRS